MKKLLMLLLVSVLLLTGCDEVGSATLLGNRIHTSVKDNLVKGNKTKTVKEPSLPYAGDAAHAGSYTAPNFPENDYFQVQGVETVYVEALKSYGFIYKLVGLQDAIVQVSITVDSDLTTAEKELPDIEQMVFTRSSDIVVLHKDEPTTYLLLMSDLNETEQTDWYWGFSLDVISSNSLIDLQNSYHSIVKTTPLLHTVETIEGKTCYFCDIQLSTKEVGSVDQKYLIISLMDSEEGVNIDTRTMIIPADSTVGSLEDYQNDISEDFSEYFDEKTYNKIQNMFLIPSNDVNSLGELFIVPFYNMKDYSYSRAILNEFIAESEFGETSEQPTTSNIADCVNESEEIFTNYTGGSNSYKDLFTVWEQDNQSYVVYTSGILPDTFPKFAEFESSSAVECLKREAYFDGENWVVCYTLRGLQSCSLYVKSQIKQGDEWEDFDEGVSIPLLENEKVIYTMTIPYYYFEDNGSEFCLKSCHEPRSIYSATTYSTFKSWEKVNNSADSDTDSVWDGFLINITDEDGADFGSDITCLAYSSGYLLNISYGYIDYGKTVGIVKLPENDNLSNNLLNYTDTVEAYF